MDIKTLKDLNTGELFVPRTSTKAVFDSEGNTLDSILVNMSDLYKGVDKSENVAGTAISITLSANTLYNCTSGAMESIEISGFSSPSPNNRIAVFTIVFIGNSNTTFIAPSSVTWRDDTPIEFDETTSYIYEVNFMKANTLNGIRYLAAWNKYPYF